MKGRALALRSLLAAAFVLAPSIMTPAHAEEAYDGSTGACARVTWLCIDPAHSKEVLGYYTGHDEPAITFYSNTPGAGNSMVYRLQLPKDPPVRPNDAGTGGTWNFQLHPAFWFGLALCDTSSAPIFTNVCVPDSDKNIFESVEPKSPHFVGKHPGAAFMELQFYPPSWVEWPAAQANPGGSSCDPTRWCAALNIDSFVVKLDPVTFNNTACRARPGVGDETVNFAFLTRDGHSIAPAGPLESFGTPGSAALIPDPNRLAFFNSGDTVEVDIHDTPDGLVTRVHDLDTGGSGSMTASPANGFAHLLFQPTSTTCNEEPYAFHPMYSTSSEKTRTIWAAHSTNVAFSDEIGHFEYCPNVADASILKGTGVCASSGSTDPAGADDDDNGCFTADMSSLVPLSGCTGTDGDFDGPEYFSAWPGTNPNQDVDRLVHASPIRFSSPLIHGEKNYERVAYETDLPSIEASCDGTTGAGCTNPPPGALFYPFYSAVNTHTSVRRDDGEQNRMQDGCAWAFGGRFLPDRKPGNFNNSTEEYGDLLALSFPVNGVALISFEDYRRVVPTNPCQASDLTGKR
jgi:hypothetical protein